MILKQSPVTYNREAHTYTLDGVRLRGVTEVIHYQIQPDSYVGIPEETLRKAADKGSAVHDAVEDFDNFGTVPTQSDFEALQKMLEAQGETPSEVIRKVANLKTAAIAVEAYKAMKHKHRLEYELSEYVVSDNKDFASPIDKVYRVDDTTVDIGDIKTISKLDKGDLEKVQWQTSIYATWLERNNPGMKVRHLYVIWLPDKRYWTKTKMPCIKKLERIPSEEVDKLFEAEINDGKYRENSIPRSERGMAVQKAETFVPAEIEGMSAYISSTLSLFKEAEKEKKEMVEKVREAMGKFNITSWSTDSFSFTQSKDSETRTFDIEAFKAAHPEIDLEPFYVTKTKKGGFIAKSK